MPALGSGVGHEAARISRCARRCGGGMAVHGARATIVAGADWHAQWWCRVARGAPALNSTIDRVAVQGTVGSSAPSLNVATLSQSRSYRSLEQRHWTDLCTAPSRTGHGHLFGP